MGSGRANGQVGHARQGRGASEASGKGVGEETSPVSRPGGGARGGAGAGAAAGVGAEGAKASQSPKDAGSRKDLRTVFVRNVPFTVGEKQVRTLATLGRHHLCVSKP